MKRTNVSLGWLLAAALCALVIAQEKLNYPKTAQVAHTDNYHGAAVADPYRWLEDDNSPETAQWVAEQNKLTFGYLEKIPYR
ncbi:MAG: S9 family peptidase, partial [Blastocatellia bacterium]